MAKNITVNMLPEILGIGPTGELDAGQTAIIAQQLIDYGNQLKEEAKNKAAVILESSEGKSCEVSGVTFKQYSAFTQARVDTAYIRRKFPKEHYPQYWKEVSYPEGIRISLPKEE